MTYKYKVDFTTDFKKEYKKIRKQNKKVDKLRTVIEDLASGKELDKKYRDHKLIDNKRFKDCRECHIESDWLLIYRFKKDELILLLVEMGSHSDLF